MIYSAKISNRQNHHQVNLKTGNRGHSIEISPNDNGFGSRASGGELLFLALATCFCNDIYRESARFGVVVTAVDVEVSGEFEAAGLPAKNVQYRVRVESESPEADLRRLVEYTDEIAEIQQTVRIQTAVPLTKVEIVRP